MTVFAPHLTNPLRPASTGRATGACTPSRRTRAACRAAPRAACIGVLPGIIGTLQANEVIKLILGVGTPADRQADDLRRDGPGVPQLQAPPRPELPRLRRPPDDHRADRLRAVLRRPDPRPQERSRKPRAKCRTPRRPHPALPAAGLPRPSVPTRASTPAGCRRVTRSSPDWEVTPREVKSMLDNGDRFVFIDCRLPNEYQITHIEGAQLIPLQQIGQRIGELRGKEDEKVDRPLPQRRPVPPVRPGPPPAGLQGRQEHGGRHPPVEQGHEPGRAAVLRPR